MPSIQFTAYFGDETKLVDVTDPLGAGGAYFIRIGGIYHGSMFKRDDRWVAFLNDNSDLTTTDIMILGDMIEGVTDA